VEEARVGSTARHTTEPEPACTSDPSLDKKE
jgi:hypothetical protein